MSRRAAFVCSGLLALAGCSAALLALAGCSASAPAPPPRAASPPEPRAQPRLAEPPPRAALDGRFDVGGGLHLHLRCEGQGEPTVVFDAGLGEEGAYWYRGEPSVATLSARVTRVCTYDRANRGQSDRTGSLRSFRDIADELYRLLARANEPGPFVLVGHSMGGMSAQFFAAAYPSSVAGLVLVDSSPEPPPLDRVPPAQRVEFETNLPLLEGIELDTFLRGFDELRALDRKLGDKPLVVLVAGKPHYAPGLPEEAVRRVLLEREQAQRPLAALSTNGRFVRVAEAGHDIPHDAPALVARAIAAVVESARTQRPLPESGLAEASPAPPSVEDAPPSSERAPPGVEGAPPSAAAP